MDPINLTFQVSPEKFQAIRRHFAEHHVEVPDEASGELEQQGVKARFTYDGTTLSVTIYDKPWIYPARVVAEKLSNFIESTQV